MNDITAAWLQPMLEAATLPPAEYRQMIMAASTPADEIEDVDPSMLRLHRESLRERGVGLAAID